MNGAAIAGGTGFATMCDFTLAVPEAKFGYTEVRIGFVPAIVSSMLVWQVGHKVARDLLLTGRLFDAAEAHALGLVNEVVEPARLMARARELAAQLMENSPSSVRATKRLINGFIAGQLDQQIAEAVEDNARIRTTADFREGITSFLEKRKPRWSGEVNHRKRARTATAWSRESRVRVRYAETDQMGVVYHANHFIWFEIGRVELMRQLGFSYRDMERDDGCFIRGGRCPLPLQSAGAVRRRNHRAHASEERPRVPDSFWLRTGARQRWRSCWPKARPRTSSLDAKMKPAHAAGKYSEDISRSSRKISVPLKPETGNRKLT